MHHSKSEVAKDVRAALAKAAERRGLSISPSDLKDDDLPAGPNLGLDSECSVGFVCDLEELGYEIDTHENLFLGGKERPRPRTVREIVNRVIECVSH